MGGAAPVGGVVSLSPSSVIDETLRIGSITADPLVAGDRV